MILLREFKGPKMVLIYNFLQTVRPANKIHYFNGVMFDPFIFNKE